MPRSGHLRLLDIRDAIRGVQDTVAGADLARYAASWQMQRAVERGLEIISESSRHVPAEVKERYPEIPWKAIAAIGNHLRHEYHHVEPAIIWEIATSRLAALAGVIETVLRESRPDPDG